MPWVTRSVRCTLHPHLDDSATEGRVNLGMPTIPVFVGCAIGLVEPHQAVRGTHTTEHKAIRTERIPQVAQLTGHMLGTSETLVEDRCKLNRLYGVVLSSVDTVVATVDNASTRKVRRMTVSPDKEQPASSLSTPMSNFSIEKRGEVASSGKPAHPGRRH